MEFFTRLTRLFIKRMNSPVKAVFSKNYKSVQARVKKLPEYTPDLIKAILKRDALMLNKNFHDGIKNRSFHLEKLSDSTNLVWK